MNASQKQRYPFYREPRPEREEEEADKLTMKRVAKNDPITLDQMGVNAYHEGDYSRAL